MTDLDLRGKRVFIRADLNVPIENGRITDDTRIRASLPGIRHALDQNAAVMVTSHLGRPREGELKPEDSLAPVAKRLAELLEVEVPLISNWVNGVKVEPGHVVVLENCRVNKGEKKDDAALARKIAALCDVYVNDAFGAAHRAEATTHAVARFALVACAGPLMAAVLDALARKVDRLIVGGGIANTFLLAAGKPIGKSLAEPELAGEAKRIMTTGKVPLPADVVVADAKVKSVDDVAAGDVILDIGPKTARAYADEIAKAGTIVWNGPVGLFEKDQFANGTRAIAEAIAHSKAYSIAGGGDTAAAINKFGVTDKIGYISTAGGAFLEFLEGKTLPAVAALEARADD